MQAFCSAPGSSRFLESQKSILTTASQEAQISTSPPKVESPPWAPSPAKAASHSRAVSPPKGAPPSKAARSASLPEAASPAEAASSENLPWQALWSVWRPRWLVKAVSRAALAGKVEETGPCQNCLASLDLQRASELRSVNLCLSCAAADSGFL